MSKMQSGLLFLIAGISLNVLGRLLMPLTDSKASSAMAGFMLPLMLSAVVLGWFGLFRLISSLVTKNKAR